MVSVSAARILIVDDHFPNVELLWWLLEPSGYTVDVAETGEAALAAVAASPPDIILLDVGLPGIDGYEVCRRLKASEATRFIPVVMVTAQDRDNKARALELGADDFLTKPVDETELLARVRTLLRAKELHDDLARTAATLRASEQRYRLLFESSLDPILLTRTDGGVLAANQAACELFGWTDVEICRRGFSGLVDIGDVRLAAALEERQRTGHFRGELTLVRKDGSRFTGEVASVVFTDTRGAAETSMIIRDLTERLRSKAEREQLLREQAAREAAETEIAERRRTAAALRDSEARLGLVLKTSADGIAILDTTGRFTFANPAAEGLLDLTPSEIEGRAYADPTWRVTEVEGRPYRETDLPFAGTLQTGQGVQGVEHTIEYPNGRRVVLSVNAAVLRDPAEAVTGAVVSLRDITERKRFEAETAHRAMHDGLTCLPNRALLHDHLTKAVALAADDRTSFALLLLDLDRFKEINDTFGHPAGDQLLQQIGPRLQEALSTEDTVARLGGDEFAILLRGAGEIEARQRAERLLVVLEPPFTLRELPIAISVGASIGIALCSAPGDDADTLLRQADIAMYAAKGAQGGYTVYAPEHDHHSPERLAMVADLRRAIEQEELVLHYQPQVDVRSGAMVAVEALVRWNHPQRGLVPPDEFIRLAEQTRLIRPLSRWVLRAALAQASAWSQSGLDIPVAVNLSTHDLEDAALPECVADLLSTYGTSPERLCLEITESALLADPARARDVLARLRGLGVRIAIDDFGTGYSSLGYLKDLPVDELKIDRSFVQGMAADAGARALVRAVIDLANDLGLRVVAEGIEDRGTWEVLAALGCDAAQGYYFCRPVPAHDLMDFATGSTEKQLDGAERARAEAALAERASQRGPRLAAEDEFLARKRAEAALRISEERLTGVLDSLDDVVWSASPTTQRLLYVNPAAERIYGHAVTEFFEQPGLLLDVVHPEDRKQVECNMERLRQEGSSDEEYRIVRPDGEVRWLHGRARLFHDAAGVPLRIDGIAMDITDRKQAEQQHQVLAQAEKLRALGQMASGVAHDLNQSLMLISGYSDLGRQALELPTPDLAAARGSLAVVTQAAMDGGETVKRLLTFGRSRPEGQAELVDLADLLAEVSQLTAPRWRDATQAEGRPIELHTEADGESVVSASPSALREALTNLVFNAVDALPHGGAIRLSARRRDDRVELEVADTGDGMPPEVQARVFEPFFTTKGERGTGLGLPQVWGIVDRHGGQITVDSILGRGTVFRITFPAAAAEARVASPATAAQEPSRPLRVLAVDDEPAIGSMVVRVLRPDGHAVVTARSGEEALQHLEHEQFDLVLSDLGLGTGMNGWELATEVRRRWPELRFVLATGWGAAIDPVEAHTKGVDAVIAKPYHPDELRRLLAGSTQAGLVDNKEQRARPAGVPTILIADDHPPIRMMLRATLSSGYRVLEAADGAEALTVAQAERPDLILLDAGMPGVDGFEVCRRLKADPTMDGVSIVMLTALDSAADRQHGIQVGADGYLTKPFSPAELLGIVEQRMIGRQAGSPPPLLGGSLLDQAGGTTAETAQVIAYARELGELHEAARERGTRLRLLVDIDQDLIAARDVTRLLELALDRAMTFGGYDGGSIMLLMASDGPLEVRVAAGADAVAPGTRAEAAEGSIAWRTLEQRRPLVLTGGAEEIAPAARAYTKDIPSSICLPLVALDGRALGVLALKSTTRPRRLKREDLEVLQLLATQISAAIDRAQLYEQLAERERRLQELFGRVLQAQEDERRRIAYEVQDGVAQIAAAAYQRLEAFAATYQPDSPGAQEDLDRARELARHAVQEARRVIAGLRPTVLDDFGLGRAVLGEVEALRAEGQDVTWDTNLGPERLPPAIETTLFRVAQEGLANVRKHAGATRVHVAVRGDGESVRLEVQDWGRGFDPFDAHRAGTSGEHFGLASLQERVGLLGGTLEVRSKPGGGTRVLAAVPLANAEQDAAGKRAA